MEYQKIISLLGNTQNEPSKPRTRHCVKINDEPRETCSKSNQIKFKASMVWSNLCACSVVYILFSGPMKITVAAKRVDEINKRAIFKNCVPFTDCLSNINNTQIDNVKYMDLVLLMYNFIEHSNSYLKTSRGLWQYYKDEPNNNRTEFESFKPKIRITRNTPDDDNPKSAVFGELVKVIN